MREPQPLNPTPVTEVPLPRAPLVRVIAQVRFPPILAIRDPDRAAGFQDAIREPYPHLSREQAHSIELTAGEPPNVHQEIIWRFADRARDPRWQVSLGVDFVALDTSAYESRQDFLDRLHAVVTAAEKAFRPAEVQRLGVRYVDRLTDEAVERVGELFHPEILGIMRPAEDASSDLGDSIIHLMNDVQFLARNGSRVQGRWGKLPPNATHDPVAIDPIDKPSWVLDLDMFTSEPQPFSSEELLRTATDFAECLYWLFRRMVTNEFLDFYGGEPCPLRI